MILIGKFSDRVKGSIHDHLQLSGDLLYSPEKALQVLYPFEVADRNTASVRQDVWNDQVIPFKKDLVRFGCSRAVRGFGDDTGLHTFSICRSNYTLNRGRDQYITGHFKYI